MKGRIVEYTIPGGVFVHVNRPFNYVRKIIVDGKALCLDNGYVYVTDPPTDFSVREVGEIDVPVEVVVAADEYLKGAARIKDFLLTVQGAS